MPSCSRTLGSGFDSLRLYLDERQNEAFARGGIADVLVTSPNGIHARLTALHRALILHDALVQLIIIATVDYDSASAIDRESIGASPDHRKRS